MKKFAVIGNPNAGKSTLVNSMTGSSLKVGNWHGVTVEREDESYYFDGEKYLLSDLPGLYTLKSSLAEESATVKALKEESYDGVVLVFEAKNYLRGISLLKEVLTLGLNAVCFVNFYSEFIKSGGKIDIKSLENSGVKFVFGEANDKTSTKRLKAELKTLSKSRSPFFSSAFSEAFTSPHKERKLNSLFLNPAITYLSFIIFVFFSVYLAFGEKGLGAPVSEMIGSFISRLGERAGEVLSKALSPFLSDLVSEGIIGGVGATAEFLPQIAIMTVCLEFLEQSGFLSRLAVVSDGVLSFFGLSGKAVYAMLSGFGCGAVACSACRGIEDDAVGKRTALSIPFVSCSAKTPVYAFVAKYCFKKYAFLVIATVYILSVFLSLFHAKLLFKTALKAKPCPLVSELADMRLPSARLMLSAVFKAVKNFALRLGTTIVIASTALFLLSKTSVDFTYLSKGGENSFIAYIGKAISPLFFPMGIKDWRYSVAVVTGIFAKEGIVSALASLFPEGIALGAPQAISFTVFCYAYTPCVTALSQTAKTVGKKYALFSALWQLAVAFLLSYSVFIIAKIIGV